MITVDDRCGKLNQKPSAEGKRAQRSSRRPAKKARSSNTRQSALMTMRRSVAAASGA
jgi:hypothetical protein